MRRRNTNGTGQPEMVEVKDDAAILSMSMITLIYHPPVPR